MGEGPLPAPFALPGGTRLLNVFHPLDPLAYRLEPLLSAEIAERPPEQAPNGAAAASAAIGASAVPSLVALAVNAGARVDWVLPKDASGDGAASAASWACPRRGGYALAEVAAFVQAASASLIAYAADCFLEDFLNGQTQLQTVQAARGQEEGLLAGRCQGWVVPSRQAVAQGAASGALGFAGVAGVAGGLGLGLAGGLSRRWEASGAGAKASVAAGYVAKKGDETGVTAVLGGTMQAAVGVVGVARAVGGSARLVGTLVGPLVRAARNT